MIAHVEGNIIKKITPSPFGTPYMKGCRKGFAAHRLDHHKDRLVTPLIRKDLEKRTKGKRTRTFTETRQAGQAFREACWEEAMGLAAERLSGFRDEYGCTALMDLSSGGACRGALHNCSDLTSRFLTLFGGATRLTGNYSSAAVSFAVPYVFGTKMTGMDAGNLKQSKLIILWGYNTVDTRFGCEFPPMIQEAKKKGVPVIVIDPRKTRTVSDLGTWWIPVRPGTDTALMAALVYRMIQKNLLDYPFIETYATGFEPFRSYILGVADGVPKTPEWASRLCSVPAADIEKLADLYGTTRPAALLPGLSLQRAIGGEEAARMAMVMQTCTGNVGIKGGSSGGAFWGRIGQPFCPSIPVPPHSDPSFPAYHWPDAVLEGQKKGWPSDIKGAYITGSNLFSQGSDINKNIKAFNQLELVIGHDFFLTPTMAMCDIVFPVASFLEREDIVFPAGNFLLYSAKAADPPKGVRTDYEIFSGLAGRLGFEKEFTSGRSARQWVDAFLSESGIPDIGVFKEAGIFMGQEQDRNALSDFMNDPKKNRLATPSGKIEISPNSYKSLGFLPYPHYRGILPENKQFPLNLITPHPLMGIHSQYANIQGFRKPDEQCLWLNPGDATERGIGQDDRVIVESPEGRLEIKGLVTDRIIKGTVSLTEGLWPDLTVSSDGRTTDLGGSANILTSTVPTLPSRSSRTHTVFVQVRRVKLPVSSKSKRASSITGAFPP